MASTGIWTRLALLGVGASTALTLVACGGGSSSSGATGSKFCTDQSAFQDKYSDVLDGTNPPSIAQYKTWAANFTSLANEAPSSIKGDLRTMAAGATTAAGSGSGFLDSAAVAEAADRVDAYVNDNC